MSFNCIAPCLLMIQIIAINFMDKSNFKMPGMHQPLVKCTWFKNHSLCIRIFSRYSNTCKANTQTNCIFASAPLKLLSFFFLETFMLYCITYLHRPVTRGGSRGSDEPPILTSFLFEPAKCINTWQ